MNTNDHIFYRYNQSSAWVGLRKDDGTVLLPAGSAASPSVRPSNDANTGLYSPGADQIGISCEGTLRLSISTTAVTTTEPIGLPDASASLPALVFSDDTDTGIYSAGANQLNIATGGARRLSLSDTSFSLVPNLTLESQAELRFNEASGNEYIALKAPSSIGSNITLTLPAVHGNTGQAMVTDGSGTLSWANAGAAKGGGTDAIFYENGQAVTADYTISNNQNAGSFGPIVINSGVTVTIGTGETWTVV
jgi:hypothetical protein